MRKSAKHPFVVFEGLSGSGKTSIAKALAKIIGGIYYSSPTIPFSLIRHEVDKRVDSLGRAYFYISSLIYLSDKIKNDIKHTPVVVDKYIYTTLAFNKARGMDFKLEDFAFLTKPDFVFLLDVKDTVRKIRMNKRGSKDPDNRKKDQLIKKEYAKLGLIKINNDGTPKDTITTILTRIKHENGASY